MTIEQFTESGTVVKYLTDIKEHIEQNGLYVSDISDSEGRQYVDLVQEGGGILGVALLGYTYALEMMNIRFVSLAGASAGGINAALMGAAAKPHEMKSLLILEKLIEKNFIDFIDGGTDALKLTNKIINKAGSLSLIWSSLGLADDFLDRNELGLNRDQAFEKWLKELFESFGIQTTQQLVDRMNDFPKGMHFDIDMTPGEAKKIEFKARLEIIVSDLTTQTKVNFPAMGDLYFDDPLSKHPATFVRASMAIPGFFDPLVLTDIPRGANQTKKWQEINKAFYFGNIPEEIVLVDGGVMSNFPIDIFHVYDRLPTRPTFGVKLGIDRQEKTTNKNLAHILLNSFTAARQMRDLDTILKNPDYLSLISNISAGDMNWLDFNLGGEAKLTLFENGVKAACSFIKYFNWSNYKELRSTKVTEVRLENYPWLVDEYTEAFVKGRSKSKGATTTNYITL